MRISRTRSAIVLAQVEKLSGKIRRELFDDAAGDAIANPGIQQRAVPGFVGDEDFEAEFADPDRIIYLQAVAVHHEIAERMTHAKLNQVAVGEGELAEREFGSYVED